MNTLEKIKKYKTITLIDNPVKVDEIFKNDNEAYTWINDHYGYNRNVMKNLMWESVHSYTLVPSEDTKNYVAGLSSVYIVFKGDTIVEIFSNEKDAQNMIMIENNFSRKATGDEPYSFKPMEVSHEYPILKEILSMTGDSLADIFKEEYKELIKAETDKAVAQKTEQLCQEKIKDLETLIVEKEKAFNAEWNESLDGSKGV